MFGESLLFLLGWFLLSIVTLGLVAPFFILSFSKFLINKSVLVGDDNIERAVTSNLKVGDDALYLILWTFLTIITGGLAGIFFIFSLGKRVLNSIEIAK
jgi:hypothetical protein